MDKQLAIIVCVLLIIIKIMMLQTVYYLYEDTKLEDMIYLGMFVPSADTTSKESIMYATLVIGCLGIGGLAYVIFLISKNQFYVTNKQQPP